MYFRASEYFVNPNKTSADYLLCQQSLVPIRYLFRSVYLLSERSYDSIKLLCISELWFLYQTTERADSFSKTYLSIKPKHPLHTSKVNFTKIFLKPSAFFTGLEVQARNSNGTGQGQKRPHFQKLLQPHGKIHCRHHHPWGYHDLEQFSWNISNKWDKDKFFFLLLLSIRTPIVTKLF